jgi:RimJ/RimL family protein N-acetyltransferase
MKGDMMARKGNDSPAPAPWLQTLRLDLREFVASDFDDEYRLDSDPRVMKYIGDGHVATRAEVAAAMKRIPRVYQFYPGLGTWRATRRDTGAYVGWFTLKYIPKTVEVEVGYRLLHEAWGQGFATEGARELVRYGFEDVGLDRIIGLTHKDNAASQHVLMKCGLQSAGWGRYYGHPLRVFVARNPHP